VSFRPPGRSEVGSALVEVTWLAVLLLVPLLYIVLAVFEVQRSAFAVTAAARAAGRAYSIAPTQAEGAARARAAAHLALADQGVDADTALMVLTCRPAPGNCLSPGSVIHVEVGYQVRLPLVPSALGGNTPSISVSASHDVPYGSFRENRP
jgi:Flp pilus assembly protein TadG